MTQKYSRWCTVCGLFTLLVLMAGCDPCMNNPCDNGLACDGEEICTADGGQAVCTDGTPVSCEFPTFCTEPDAACVDPCDGADCSDDNDCTTDFCTTNQDGTTTCDSDTSCDDADACTDGDTCDDDGECAGTAIECATGEVCADGICVCADDSACDDGDRCTGVETCDVETGECVAGTPVDCDDGEFCNGLETCEPDAETGEPTCVDGIAPCAAGETCDEEADECLRSCNNDTECDDGNFCNGEETCDTGTGMCVEGLVLDCDDGDPCTDLTCDESAGCMFMPTVCAEGFTCDPVTGECGSTNVGVGLSETMVSFDHNVGSTECPQEFGSFVVTNTGSVETMYTISVGSAPLTTDSPSFTLAPGESQTVALTFTCAQSTSFMGTITVTGEGDGQVATGVLEVTGNVG